MSYHRTSSPGRRAIQNYGRISDLGSGTIVRDPYGSPRASGERIIPAAAPTSYTTARPSERLIVPDGYSRPRRSTVNESQRPQSAFLAPLPRSTPLAQSSRPISPLPRPKEDDSHRKKTYYAVGGEKTHLVADHSSSGRSRHSRQSSIDRSRDHHRRSSVDRNGYTTTVGGGRGAPKEYHLSGPVSRDAGPGYSYTEPAAMYTETEPVYRRRRGSVDGSRERPKSMMVESSPRTSTRDQGPPTSRAMDRYNEGVLRSSSVRQPAARPVPRSTFDDGYGSQDEYNDRTRVPRRGNTLPVTSAYDYDQRLPPSRPHTTVHDRPSEYNDPYLVPVSATRDLPPSSPYDDRFKSDPRYDDRREPRAHERIPQPKYKDASVERRGFGLRASSIDRHANRGSNESFERRPAHDDRLAPSTSDRLQ